MKRLVSMSLDDGAFFLWLWCGTEDQECFKVKAPKTKRYNLTKKEQRDMMHLAGEYDKLHKTATETKGWLTGRML